MSETQFKKGQRQQNHLPVGTIMPNTDGYLRMKVADLPLAIAGNGALSANWMFVHRMVWEQAHGPIPPGHRIWWKDGDHTNCALENLELLTGAEHMARTTIHNWPEDIKRVMQLNGVLKRQLRRIEERNGKEHDGRSAEPPLRDHREAQG